MKNKVLIRPANYSGDDELDKFRTLHVIEKLKTLNLEVRDFSNCSMRRLNKFEVAHAMTGLQAIKERSELDEEDHVEIEIKIKINETS